MPPRILDAQRGAPPQALLDLVWDIDPRDPFPPAKSDDEIAELLDQMGAELGVFDPTRHRIRRAVVRARPAPPASAPTCSSEAATMPRIRGVVPPPLPTWARAAAGPVRRRVG